MGFCLSGERMETSKFEATKIHHLRLNLSNVVPGTLESRNNNKNCKQSGVLVRFRPEL